MKFFSALSRNKRPHSDRKSGYPDIVIAVWRDDLKRLRKLAKEPDVVDPDGRTALMAAAIDSKMEAARILIDAGANFDVQDPQGWSALHFAAQSGSEEIARILLEGGANVDPRDSYGNTPLGKATFESQGNGEMIMLLRSFGADPLMKNEHGVSPLELARTIGDCDVAQFYSDL